MRQYEVELGFIKNGIEHTSDLSMVDERYAPRCQYGLCFLKLHFSKDVIYNQV